MQATSKYRHLRMMDGHTQFVQAISYDALDHLISVGMLTCGEDGDWVLTPRGERSLRARETISLKARRVATAAKRSSGTPSVRSRGMVTSTIDFVSQLG